MNAPTVLILCFASCIGCNGGNDNASSSPNSYPESVRIEDGVESALSKISAGTMEMKLVALMKPHSLDSGVVYWGGTGARRMYFQIAPDKQIWFQLSGPADGNSVTEIGAIEPKTNWTRHDGDSITVDK